MILKEIMKEKGLTQCELAQLMNKSQQAISLWARGFRSPQPADMIKLAKILEVSEKDILECFAMVG